MKKRKYTYIGIIAAGLVIGIIAALGRDIPVFQSGVLSGMAASLTVVGIIRLVRQLRLEKDPEKAAEYEAALQDERLIYISNKARAWTFVITIIVELLGGLVAIFGFDQRVLGQALCYLVCFQCLLFVVIFRILNKKY